MKRQFRFAVGLLVAGLLVAVGTYMGLWDLHFTVGAIFFHHLVAQIGGAYLFIATIVFVYMKRKTAVNRGTLLKVHVFGHLMALILVVTHFALHLNRAVAFSAGLGTGLATFLLLAVLIATGFLMRFGLLPKKRTYWHQIHVGMSLSFFIVLAIHTLEKIGFL